MELMKLFKPNIERMARKMHVEGLIRALTYDKDYRIRHGAAKFLGVIGDGKALEPLSRTLHDTHSLVRAGAAEALGAVGDPKAIEDLIVALMDPNRGVYASAVKSLKRIGGHRAVLLLVDVLAYGKDDRVRFIASDVLVELDDKRAVEPLLQVLKQENPRSRGLAVSTLGRIDAKNAIGHLIPLLEDPEADVQRRTMWALRKITGRDLGGAPDPWWEWWVETVIRSAVTCDRSKTRFACRRGLT